jgi:hypothetical protein
MHQRSRQLPATLLVGFALPPALPPALALGTAPVGSTNQIVNVRSSRRVRGALPAVVVGGPDRRDRPYAAGDKAQDGTSAQDRRRGVRPSHFGIDDWPAVLGRWRTGSSGAVAQLQRGQVFGQADRPPCGARPAQPRHATRLAMTICSALVAR